MSVRLTDDEDGYTHDLTKERDLDFVPHIGFKLRQCDVDFLVDRVKYDLDTNTLDIVCVSLDDTNRMRDIEDLKNNGWLEH